MTVCHLYSVRFLARVVENGASEGSECGRSFSVGCWEEPWGQHVKEKEAKGSGSWSGILHRTCVIVKVEQGASEREPFDSPPRHRHDV